MKQLLTVMALLVSTMAFAQIKIRVNGRDTVLPILQGLQPFFNQSVASMDKMPNALNGFTDNQQFKNNNNQGYDVYQSQMDNMLVLKPDATNLASLSNNDNFVYKPADAKVVINLAKPNTDQPLPKLKKFKLDKLPLSPQ